MTKQIHHINLDRKDNSESNLIKLEVEDHGDAHKSLNKIKAKIMKKLLKLEIIKYSHLQNKYFLDEILWQKFLNLQSFESSFKKT